MTPAAIGGFWRQSDGKRAVRTPAGGDGDCPGPGANALCQQRSCRLRRRDRGCRADAGKRRPAAAEHPGYRSGRSRGLYDACCAVCNACAGRDRHHPFGAGIRRRQVHHRFGWRHRDRREASRPTGRRKVRPHPRRQEGALHRRDVLRRPRLRAALDRRRRDERSRQDCGGLSRGRRCRWPRSERISGAADQGRHGARGARRSRNQVHRRGADLRAACHERPRALQPRLRRHRLRPCQARSGQCAGPGRQGTGRRRGARQLQSAAAAVQGAQGQARRGARRQGRRQQAGDPARVRC